MGSVALDTWNVGSPVTAPAILAMEIRAVQLIVIVDVFPMLTWPKSTGWEHFSGRETGEPRQMMLPFVSET